MSPTNPPDFFPRVMAIFEQASALEGAARSEVIERECAGDDALRREVESLLDHHQNSVAPVATGVGFEQLYNESAPASRPAVRAENLPPAPVLAGEYRVLRVLGEGGMGVVFEAEQAFPRRRVALKALRPGFASRGLLRRFRNEAQLLARLHHPGIAQIYDAGVADEHSPDQAFFAMELVDGRPLHAFADDHALDTRARIALLLKVCDAVQHAHQRGIIHRDLKPANILVTPDGQPKILDFGVARAVDADDRSHSLATIAGQIIGTFPYMSPEQVSGDPDIDTRSDVYALGVIAYQLLTRRLPLDVADLPMLEAARVIREREPVALSVIDRTLRGDVDVIVRKALSKERERRYASAADLAEDLRRFLVGEPIAARRDSAIYVLRKQVRRHRVSITVGLCFLTGLIAFAVYAQVQSTRNRKLALALADELSTSRIERGRMLATVGNPYAGEQALWREFMARPTNPIAHWALRGHYAVVPILRTPARIETNVDTLATHRNADGSGYCAGGGPDGIVRVWTLDLKRLLYQVKPCAGGVGGASGGVGAIAFSPDGTKMLAGGASGDFVLYNAADGTQIWTMNTGASFGMAAEFSPDGAAIAIAGDTENPVRLYDAATGARIRDFPNSRFFVRRIRFSPDGRSLALAGRTVWLHVYNVATGQVAQQVRAFEIMGWAVLYSPDGRIIFTGDGTGLVRMISTDTWEVIGSMRSEDRDVRSLLLMPDERTLLVGGDQVLETWDVPSLKRTATLGREVSGTFEFAPGPTDDTFITNGMGSRPRLFELRQHAAGRVLGDIGRFWAVGAAVSPDTTQVCIGGADGRAHLWGLSTGEKRGVIQTPTQGLRAVDFTADGRTVAIGGMDGAIRLYDVGTLEEKTQFKAFDDTVGSLQFSPDGRMIAASGWGGDVGVWDAHTLEPRRTITPHEGRSVHVSFSPDSRLLASVGRGGGGAVGVGGVGGGGGGLQITDLRDGSVRYTRAAEYMYWGATFSPDGTLLAVANPTPTIDLFDAATMTKRVTFEGHGAPILDMAFHPTQPLLASGSADGTFCIWDLRTGQCLLRTEFPGGQVSNLGFFDNGRRLVVSGQDGRVFTWDLEYYDQHIVGNMTHLYQKLGPTMSPPPDRTGLEAFARRITGDATFTLPDLPAQAHDSSSR